LDPNLARISKPFLDSVDVDAYPPRSSVARKWQNNIFERFFVRNLGRIYDREAVKVIDCNGGNVLTAQIVETFRWSAPPGENQVLLEFRNLYSKHLLISPLCQNPNHRMPTIKTRDRRREQRIAPSNAKPRYSITRAHATHTTNTARQMIDADVQRERSD
jgi:hypothetical protein